MIMKGTPTYLTRPHNCYNIFFILEREKFIQARGSSNAVEEKQTATLDIAGFYGSLNLPGLPPRYQDLVLSNDWYVPGKKSNRKHVKSHGLASFSEMAKTVAKAWKTADKDTGDYCRAVACKIKERHDELKQIGGIMKFKKKKKKKKKVPRKKACRRASMPNPTAMAPGITENQANPNRSASIGNCSRPVMTPGIIENQANPSRSASIGGFTRPYDLDMVDSSFNMCMPTICCDTQEQDITRYPNKYALEEVDISDSDIREMWMSVIV